MKVLLTNDGLLHEASCFIKAGELNNSQLQADFLKPILRREKTNINKLVSC